MINLQDNVKPPNLNFNPSDRESFNYWSVYESNKSLGYLIEKELLPVDRERESTTSTNKVFVLVLILCLVVFGSGLVFLSKNIHSITQQILTE